MELQWREIAPKVFSSKFHVRLRSECETWAAVIQFVTWYLHRKCCQRIYKAPRSATMYARNYPLGEGFPQVDYDASTNKSNPKPTKRRKLKGGRSFDKRKIGTFRSLLTARLDESVPTNRLILNGSITPISIGLWKSSGSLGSDNEMMFLHWKCEFRKQV